MVRAEAAPDLDYIRFHTVLSRLYALLRRAAQSGDLSLTAASTLRTLDQSGVKRLTDLASCEGVSQPAMTQLVTRLEREGYVGRDTDPTDGRVVLIRITPVGQDLLRRRRDLTAARVKSLVHGLSPADAALIEAALPALERMADLDQTPERNRMADLGHTPEPSRTADPGQTPEPSRTADAGRTPERGRTADLGQAPESSRSADLEPNPEKSTVTGPVS